MSASATISVFGLSVSADFPLPAGIPACEAASLPAVALEIASPERLEAEWSGAVAPEPWRGKLGDGLELAIEWGRGGDLLFRYGDRASFLLGAAHDRLRCAPMDPASSAWLRVLLTRVLPNVAIANGYEALHASAVATEHGTVAVAAASGSGKSTLALELVKRGRPLFADDTVVLGRRAGEVEAHPSGPFANLPPSAEKPTELGTDLGLVDGERWVAIADTASEPAPVAAIVLLERRPGELLGASSVSASPLALAPFMLGLPDHEGRDATRFSLYSDLVQSTRLLRLTADVGHSPADLAEVLERALELGAPAAVGGVA
jgi:hypothetical protein